MAAEGLLLLVLVGGILWGFSLSGKGRRRRAAGRRRQGWSPQSEADRRAARNVTLWTRRGPSGLTMREWHAGRAVPTQRGDPVRSVQEARVADWLHAHGIGYEYEPEVRGFRPDFLIPGPKVIIEYWGGRDGGYDERRRLKTAVHLREGYQLVSLEAGKSVSLEEDLRRQLWHKGVRPVPAATQP